MPNTTKNKEQEKRSKGFTLVELIISIAIISILAVIVTVGWNGVTTSSANNVRASEVKQWASTFDLYKSRYGAWPVLPANDSSPVSLCLGDFAGGKCGNLSSQFYPVNSTLLDEVKKVGRQPENTASPINNLVVGPIAYISQLTAGTTVTVTIKYVGVFQGTNCPSGFTSDAASSGLLTGLPANSAVACALKNPNNTFTYDK